MGYVRKLVEYGHPTRLQLPFRMMAAGDKHASRAQGVGHFPVVLRVTHEQHLIRGRPHGCEQTPARPELAVRVVIVQS